MNYRRLTQYQSIEAIFYPIDEKSAPSYNTNFKAISNEALLMPIYQYCHYLFPHQAIQQVVETDKNQRFFVKFRFLEQEKTVLEQDKIYPQLIIENSYDGSIQPKVGLGYVRVICTNGLMRFDQLTEIEIEDNSNVIMEQLSPVFEQLQTMEVSTAKLLPTFRRLANRRINQNEINWFRRELTQHRNLNYSSRLIDRALLVASLEADALTTPMSAWLLYNGFNHALNHIPFAFKHADLRRLDGQIFDLVEKVIQPSYQPIVLPKKSVTTTATKQVKQTRFCGELAGV